MRDLWYGDKRDLVKWATLVSLAQQFRSRHILQVLYYRPTVWDQIKIDGKLVEMPNSVIRHFRDVNSIRRLSCGVIVETVPERFDGRSEYLETILVAIPARTEAPGIVFLDPDTGLEPKSGKYDHSHVCIDELKGIWGALSARDLLVLYQHEDNKRNEEWRERKRRQFAAALASHGVSDAHVKLAHAPGIARDVAFYFAQKH